MVKSSQITPGMVLFINKKLYQVESCVKVTVPKGTPFVRSKLKSLTTGKVTEKNFKVDQIVEDVSLVEKNLEFLYLEGKDFLFLDVDNLEHVLVPSKIISERASYLKEGIELKGSFYGDYIFSVELPQFMELMVAKTESANPNFPVSNAAKTATLETGAKVEVPPFIDVGDIIKVDTRSDEYIQRV